MFHGIIKVAKKNRSGALTPYGMATNYTGVDYMDNININTQKKKSCFRCNIVFLENESNFEKRGKGFRGTCKRCQKEQRREYYLKNKESFLEKSKEQNLKRKAENKRRKATKEKEVTSVGNWKQIDGYENYLISDEGEVFSKYMGQKNTLSIRKDGYVVTGLWKNNKSKNVYVHRLVMEAFNSEFEDETVNHIDGDKTNNHISNLEWSTYAENNRHAIETGLNTTEHKRNKKGSIPVAQYTKDGDLIKIYPSMRQAERETGISATEISLGVRKGWKYGGYTWELTK